MPQVSKHQLSPKTWHIVWQQLVKALGHNSTGNDLFLKGLFTPTEQVMLSKRIMVGILTLSGWAAVDIAETLKLSPSTAYKLQTYILVNQAYQKEIEKRFPQKIPFKKEYKQKDWLSTLLTDIFAGYRDRSRLHYR